MGGRDMDGRSVLITGGNTGIGKATATELARRGAQVTIACRSRARGEAAAREIGLAAGGAQVDLVELDLARLESVRSGARSYLDLDRPLHVLINNAGVAGHPGVSPDGFELTFAVNHLGHFLFTLLLMDRIRQSTPARIVNVSSRAHYGATGIEFDALRESTSTRVGMAAYQVSKLANVLFTRELTRRLAGSGVDAFALHPGVIASDIWRGVPALLRPIIKLFMRSTEEGAETSVHCATAPELEGNGGGYYHDCRPKEESAPAQDDALAAELWRRSLEWTGAPDLAPV